MSANQINNASIALFQTYLAERKSWMKSRYQQLLAQDLSRQQWDGCFQRNVLAVLAEVYQHALEHLKTLPFADGAVDAERGMSLLTRKLLCLFGEFVDEFLLFVVDKHRTSCALSNFPDEHKPSDDYVNRVRREIAGYWRDFALAANEFFLECR
ncbi:MAG: amine oxidase [Gammaproteobacteria bacterium]